MLTPLRRLALGCALVAAVVGCVAIASAPAAWAGTGPCETHPKQDFCVGVGHGSGGSATPVTSPAGGRGGAGHGTYPPPACGWATVDADLAQPWIASGGVINGAPPAGTVVTWQAWCINDPSAPATYGGPFRWVAAAAPVITPVRVAAGMYEELQGRMPTPVVVTNPPIGTASIVGVPVFASVANWRSTITVTRSLAGVPVTVTATPQLLFDSGEPGAEPELCTGPGKRFAAGGGDLSVQASARDACTHIYAHRTGADDRPAVWPGTVTVRWTIAWVSGDGGSGAFPVVNRTTAVPRSVDEVQTVVVAGGRP